MRCSAWRRSASVSADSRKFLRSPAWAGRTTSIAPAHPPPAEIALGTTRIASGPPGARAGMRRARRRRILRRRAERGRRRQIDEARRRAAGTAGAGIAQIGREPVRTCPRSRPCARKRASAASLALGRGEKRITAPDRLASQAHQIGIGVRIAARLRHALRAALRRHGLRNRPRQSRRRDRPP